MNTILFLFLQFFTDWSNSSLIFLDSAGDMVSLLDFIAFTLSVMVAHCSHKTIASVIPVHFRKNITSLYTLSFTNLLIKDF